jgi:hypothetical protein
VEGPWEAVNGDGGTLVPLESEGIYALVVMNNARCQERVEVFLDGLRSLRHGNDELTEIQKQSKPLKLAATSKLHEVVERITPLTADQLQAINSVVQSGNHFASNLYARLAEAPNENLCVSPYSISSALMMACAGAKGRTAEQIYDVLKFDIRPEYGLSNAGYHELMRLLRRHLAPGIETKHYKLRIANRLWAQQNHPILDSFRALTKEKYGAEIAHADFVNDRDGARRTINEWIALQTSNLIPELLHKDDIDGLTRTRCILRLPGRFRFPSREQKRPSLIRGPPSSKLL